jgi:hypothetical protein
MLQAANQNRVLGTSPAPPTGHWTPKDLESNPLSYPVSQWKALINRACAVVSPERPKGSERKAWLWARSAAKQHEISTGTPDLKLAKRFHRHKLDELAADRQGLKQFTTPQHRQLQFGSLLDDLVSDYRVRRVKSLGSALSHIKPVRDHFGDWRAMDLNFRAIENTSPSVGRKGGRTRPSLIFEVKAQGQKYDLVILRLHGHGQRPPFASPPQAPQKYARGAFQSSLAVYRGCMQCRCSFSPRRPTLTPLPHGA